MFKPECGTCAFDYQGACTKIMHGLACGYAEKAHAWTPGEAGPMDRSVYASIAAQYSETQKPTNPKDTIGIRKAPMSTVSGAVMAEVGTAMLEGAAKYGRHNYRVVGVRASVYYDATMRHLIGWWEGEDLDPDSGLSHVTKAIASLVVLRDAMINGKCEDDRPPACAPFYGPLNTEAGRILDRHADKSPTHYTQAGQATGQSLRAAGLDDEHDALTFGERTGSIE